MKHELKHILKQPSPIQIALVKVLMSSDAQKNEIIGYLSGDTGEILDNLVDLLFEIGLTDTEIQQFCNELFNLKQ